MPRPPIHRMVEREPICTVFKPAGRPMAGMEEVVVTVEGIEAIRLKDLLGLDQEECAECMHVSRATFQRLLTVAREGVARAIVEGRPLRIQGGHYRLRGACQALRGPGRRRARCRRQCYQTLDGSRESE
ncbi:MAG: DUF134 domain-containing protein [Bacillota bacterium]|jgi:predicted DNA-binding protein (UPF0251 family)